MKKLTSGSPWKLILSFTIPLLVGNFFQQMYSFTDTLVVGQILGKDALAAVGSTGSLMFLMMGFSMGLTSGFAIITAQRFGAKDYVGVKCSFATSVCLSGIATIILTVINLFFLRPILLLMQTPDAIIDMAEAFFRFIVIGFFATMICNLLSNILRSIGDSQTPLFFLIISTIINVVLELFFILILKMGVVGAGVATLLAQAIAGLLCLFYIYRKIPILQIHFSDLKKIKKEDLIQHIHSGVPMAFQASIIAIGSVILQSVLNSLGTDVVAAQASSSRIDQFAILPMMSFGITMATFTAQNWGAKKYKRIIKGVKQGLLLSIAFSIMAGIIEICFGENLVKLFVKAKEVRVIALAQTYFNINGSMYWILSILFILRYTLQGLGKTAIPTIAGIVELLMRSGSAIILTLFFGFIGAAWAAPLAWSGAVIILMPSYLISHKKLKRM
ncbi:MAG: MATE family efflux transporter [Streptococcaceae bacterium]|jgi:putative MATE family efflux protein|nr:MATE family efflux transporter [Streptococcaceae bacterium]